MEKEGVINIFWMVWNEGKATPMAKHWTEGGALVEAERLAIKHPGETFHVLALVDSCIKREVFWASQLPEETPF